MKIELSETDKGYLKGFNEFKNYAHGSKIRWLSALREEAINKFTETGFPTPRDENWRFTNLAPISRSTFNLSKNGLVQLSKDKLDEYLFQDLKTSLLVFVDDRFNQSLSSVGQIPSNVKVSSLSKALSEDEDLVKQYLAKYSKIEGEAFTALNNAFMEDGAFIFLKSKTELRDPIHLLFISTGNSEQTFFNIRNLIVLEDNSSASVIEHYVSLTDGVYLSNVVSEVVVGENSNLEHYLIERESKRAYNVSTLRVEQARSSNITSHTVLLGGALVRNNVHPVLAGEGCSLLINGLYMANGRQHMDNYMKVEHASPHCDSRQLYNGVLDGRSHGVFHGRIVVHKGAQKTDAKQTNRNLLLSDFAQIDTKPQLEIYADDVKCTHGATIGQMDEDAIFYLRSRGLNKETTHSLMLHAFTSESLENMKIEQVRKYLDNLISQWFAQRKSAE